MDSKHKALMILVVAICVVCCVDMFTDMYTKIHTSNQGTHEQH